MNIGVFCSASDVEKKYTEPAIEFAKLLANAGHHLVWGGSDRGLMKLVADTFQTSGGKIYGVSMEILRSHARKNADEMTVAKDLGERKAMMLKRSDVVVMMVGGIGSLDEVMGVLELKKHRVHQKPVVVLNTRDFYRGLHVQLKRMRDDGFIDRPLDELIHFADTPKDAMRYIEMFG